MHGYDIVIVGGGISGLAAAYRLKKEVPHLSVALLEATSRLGGKIETERWGGFVLEGGPDCFLSRKPRGIGLCEELGIADQLVGRQPLSPDGQRAYVLRHGELHPLPEGLTGLVPTNLEALQKSTLLSDEGKARVAEEPKVPPLELAEDEPYRESVAGFVSRRLGRETYENIVEPLMSGI
ncbi:MAG: protoporphyrinogen oxidase, partial [Chloroflexota bacterium]